MGQKESKMWISKKGLEEVLYKDPSDAWYVVCQTGEGEEWAEISPAEARQWLKRNGHDYCPPEMC